MIPIPILLSLRKILNELYLLKRITGSERSELEIVQNWIEDRINEQ